MSTLVSTIIQQAFREGNFIAVGEVPTADEVAEAVPRLNGFISSLFGFELGEQYREWAVPSAQDPAVPLRTLPQAQTGSTAWAYPPANSRLLVALTTAQTVYFPAMPSDGARMALVDAASVAGMTLHGNGRLIEGAASLVGFPSSFNGRKWLYRADLGDWIRLGVLVEEDEVPLPPEFDDLLICGMAVRLAPRYGVEISSATTSLYMDMLERLKQRYRQSEAMPISTERWAERTPSLDF